MRNEIIPPFPNQRSRCHLVHRTSNRAFSNYTLLQQDCHKGNIYWTYASPPLAHGSNSISSPIPISPNTRCGYTHIHTQTHTHTRTRWNRIDFDRDSRRILVLVGTRIAQQHEASSFFSRSSKYKRVHRRVCIIGYATLPRVHFMCT